MKKLPPVKTITFTNFKGETLQLPETMTIAELTKLGMKVDLQPKLAPIKRNRRIFYYPKKYLTF